MYQNFMQILNLKQKGGLNMCIFKKRNIKVGEKKSHIIPL